MLVIYFLNSTKATSPFSPYSMIYVQYKCPLSERGFAEVIVPTP